MKTLRFVAGAAAVIASTAIVAAGLIGGTGSAQAAPGDPPPPGPTRCVPGQQPQPNCRPGNFGRNRGPRTSRVMPGAGGLGFTDVIGTVAGSIGMTRDQLVAQLRSGKSMSDVALSRGKPADELKSIIATQAKADLKKAVADGKMPQRLADAMTRNLDRFITRLINIKGQPFNGVRPDGQGRPGGVGPQSTPPGTAPVPPAGRY